MTRQLRRSSAHRWWPVASGVIALALLLAQTLGLLHGIAHGLNGAGASSIAARAHADAEPSHATHEPHARVAGLFDTHEDESAECQLYDQLTHGDVLWSAIAAFTAPAPLPPLTYRAAQAPRGACASWSLARAPPQRA